MNSIFKKQFLYYTGILVLSFVLLGTGLTKAFSSFFVEQKKEMLIEQGEKIARVFTQAYYWGGIYNKEKLNNEITILDEYLDASFIYVDSQKTIYMISNDISATWLGQTLDIDIVDDAVTGHIVETQGTMGGIFDRPVLTIGYPITAEGSTIGAIFMNSPMTELQQTMHDVYRIIIIFMCIAILLGFVLIFISSKNMSKPLREMNEAAKVISNGDFEKRISVSSKDEMGQLAASFNEMAESLYNQDKRRREFLSNISHDLRSPLTSMRGFLNAILDGTVPTEMQDKYLNIVLDESDRLASLANNILDITKLEEADNQLNLSRLELNELIRTTILTLESRVISKNISIQITFEDEQTFVIADSDKIQRVIYNLLDNALKFTDNGGEISITTQIQAKKVYVSIKDNGVGISAEDQKRIFDRFYKVDASRGLDKKGSGLGLSIVKDFIKAHNCTINLKSELGKGSEFIFCLPLDNS